ncbi:cytochrome c biogenesis protein CcmG, thiol:disulfide interchange protein DsbE [Monaibacterium marinum]|uniref:Cytochrome c biogenesis protein CcmG, thiol:disulfide interchange protein DsbE n=1 Tax=Pontivivens marinum TaxID=1690039 RepID=A0A2C9CRH6_9RHOB|nr:DsbE family thiol:disulfide interchange protein [Monaibacterium marinum]SOH94151.1 cytochrome c biogenesis protein CcmG, thiol:disulfide interchange protein DsbE [Monaibacterium marinum]
MAKRKLSPILIVPVIAASILGTFLWAMLRDNPDELQSQFIAQPAPPLSVEPFGGPLPELGGEVMLVNFWASWCGPCRVEHPVLMQLAEEGIPIVGVNYKDDPEDARAFLAELGDPYTAVGADETGRTGIDWGLYGVPETFVIDSEGRVVLRFPGPVTPGALEARVRPAIEAAR